MKKIILIGFVLLLSGCSTKFVYKNVDWLIYWYVDDFVELTSEQEDAVDVKLAQWLDWHKKNELPNYLAHLKELSNDIAQQQLSLARMDYHQDKVTDHWLRIRTHIIPDLVEMAPMLSDDQIASLFTEIEEKNKEDAEEREERTAMSPEKRKKEVVKRNQKNLKRWLGKLNTEQETLIENMYGEYHSNGELWSEYRQRYQGELRALFAAPDRGPDFKASLHKMLMYPHDYRSDLLNQRNDENGQKYKSFLLAIDALTTEKQREHLIDEIGDFVEDLNDLIQ